MCARLDITPAKIPVAFLATTLLLPVWIACERQSNGDTRSQQVMPDDNSELVPPLPIPNRTVKRLRADDSAATSVKVGHRQACYVQRPWPHRQGRLLLGVSLLRSRVETSSATQNRSKACEHLLSVVKKDVDDAKSSNHNLVSLLLTNKTRE